MVKDAQLLVGGSEVPECLKVEENTVRAGAVMGGTRCTLPAAQTLGGEVQLALCLHGMRSAGPHATPDQGHQG